MGVNEYSLWLSVNRGTYKRSIELRNHMLRSPTALADWESSDNGCVKLVILLIFGVTRPVVCVDFFCRNLGDPNLDSMPFQQRVMFEETRG